MVAFLLASRAAVEPHHQSRSDHLAQAFSRPQSALSLSGTSPIPPCRPNKAMDRGPEWPATFCGYPFRGHPRCQVTLVSRLFAGMFIRRLNCLHMPIQVVGLRRL